MAFRYQHGIILAGKERRKKMSRSRVEPRGSPEAPRDPVEPVGLADNGYRRPPLTTPPGGLSHDGVRLPLSLIGGGGGGNYCSGVLSLGFDYQLACCVEMSSLGCWCDVM